jgi:hypothetical protein
MPRFQSTNSSFVIKNISKSNIRLFGVPIGTNKKADLFKSSPNITEAQILNGLRAPSGELYKKLKNQEIEIVEYQLLLLDNVQVGANNFITSNQAEEGKS